MLAFFREKLSLEQRFVAGGLLGFLVLLLGMWATLLVAGDSISQTILDGGSFKHLQRGAYRILAGTPVEQYPVALRAKLLEITGRITIIFLGCGGILAVGSWWRPHLFRDFFAAETHPLNLAVLRIVYFVTLFPRVNLRSLIELSQLDANMRVMPPGLGWFGAILPQSPALIETLYWIFAAACLLGVLGFGSRLACLVAAVLSFYMLGVPQLFGKIHHMHHLIWVGGLLSVSRCGDCLAIDAVLKSLRGRWQTPLVPKVEYALPLRFVWLFLGIIYFFPGFWKYVISGNEWFLSTNLQSRMLLRIFVSDGWEPMLRIDRSALLCSLGGLTTIVMEMAFIFLIFLPRGRYFAAGMGLLFHTLVDVFLNISFWPIQSYYVSFLDTHGVLRWLAHKSGYEGLQVRIGPTSPLFRAVRAAQTVDIFSQLNVQMTSDDTFTVTEWNGNSAEGRDAWKRVVAAVPLIWLFRPLLPLATKESPQTHAREPSLRMIYGVGTAVLVANSFCGFTLIDSWPVGVYPTFATIVDTSVIHSLTMLPLNAAGNPIDEVELLYDRSMRRVYPSDRLPYVLLEIAFQEEGREERLLTLWNIWLSDHPERKDTQEVVFAIAEYSVKPEDKANNPLRRQILQKLSVAPTPTLP